MLTKIKNILYSSFVNDELRKNTMFDLLNVVLFLVAFFMSVVNIITKQYTLMIVTLIFSVGCLLNLLLVRIKNIKKTIIHYVFAVEAIIMLGYFVVSGNPEGFSVLWLLLVPSFSLAIFKTKAGGAFSLVVFIMVIFFFWFPFGKELLLYNYNETFMLRFPFVYIALFAIALYIEYIRLGTYAKVREIEKEYRYLYRHDALTGIYNRHAFYEELESSLIGAKNSKAALVLFDIDDFKLINDTYGHNIGDKVLQKISEIIMNNTCEHCITCRWGGEEFLVLMQCDHNPQLIADKIRDAVSKSAIIYGDSEIKFTISAGISYTTELTLTNITEHINKADKAMYVSKTNGKNKTTLFDE